MTEPPYPSLQLRFQIGPFHGEATALVDTGFDGHLAVPEAVIEALAQPLYMRPVQLADGQVVQVAAYSGTLELVLQPSLIPVVIIALGDEYLVGLATINHFRLTFDHGQRLVVEP